MQEPVKLFDASEFCGTGHPYGRHAFAGNAPADAFVLTSLTGQTPVLHTEESGRLSCKLAGKHNSSSHSCRLASADGCSHQCFSRLLGPASST